ncbi:biotin--[acetyl-CoA-carboxylase] ligase [Leptolinea sp. HRD-7]|nr:biotin--[acetyl-CoA-carboxylase] ligase [Leptolinea sp. HRD-7]
MTDLNLAILKKRLTGLSIAEIRYYEQTGSTNDDALNWISNGAPDRSLVIADEQTAGRGRMDRKWVTRKGTSLAFSIIFKPQGSDRIPFYAPLGALGVALALERMTTSRPLIKWPNDVLLGGKKVSGILAEASWEGDRFAGLVLGIGINIATSSVSLDDDFLFPADSLQHGLGIELNRIDLLAEVLWHIFQWQERIGSNEFLTEWNRRLAFRGEQVHINRPGMDGITGEVLRIGEDGKLWIRQKNGIDISISAGDVSLRQTGEKPDK